MRRFLSVVLSLIALVVIGTESNRADAQDSRATASPIVHVGQSATMAVSIVLPKEQVPAGQPILAQLTVKNLASQTISFPHDRVHVEIKGGEAPTKLRQRQLTQTLRPGEPQLRSGGFEPEIEPGNSSLREYDLSQLYDLSKPGTYSVYIEVLDVSASKHNAGVWVRSNTAQFEIQAAGQ
jgi:hypothetical protein